MYLHIWGTEGLISSSLVSVSAHVAFQTPSCVHKLANTWVLSRCFHSARGHLGCSRSFECCRLSTCVSWSAYMASINSLIGRRKNVQSAIMMSFQPYRINLHTVSWYRICLHNHCHLVDSLQHNAIVHVHVVKVSEWVSLLIGKNLCTEHSAVLQKPSQAFILILSLWLPLSVQCSQC